MLSIGGIYKMKNILLQKKKVTLVHLDGMRMHLAGFEGGEVLKTETLLLHETPEEKLRSSVRAFCGDKPGEILAVIPRSEILQKEVLFAAADSGALKEQLETQLQSVLPFQVNQMAWGLWTEEPCDAKVRGMLFAAPEKKISETLNFLERLGFPLESLELVSEDQVFLWAALARREQGPVLWLDFNSVRLLVIFFRDGKLIYSHSFEGCSEDKVINEILPELSLKLLEFGVRAEKIWFSGTLSPEARNQLAGYFSAPLSDFTASPSFPAANPVMSGAAQFDRFPYISLLPKQAKLEKRQRTHQKMLRTVALTAAGFAAVFGLLFSVRLAALNGAVKQAEAEIAALVPDKGQAEKVLTAMKHVNTAKASRDTLLRLLHSMALNLSPSIDLQEIRVMDKEFVFRGRSASYNSISETVAVLEENSFLEKIQLQGTRLRRQGMDKFLEFEVRGQWQI